MVEPLEQRTLLSVAITFAAPVVTPNVFLGQIIDGSISDSFAYAGDFNGDGRTDLALNLVNASTLENDTEILLANGSGGFTETMDLGPGESVRGIGDFTGDGKADLLTIAGVMPGRGDGTFDAPVGGGFGANLPIPDTWAGIGDLNGDGKADIVTASFAQFGDPISNGAGHLLYRFQETVNVHFSNGDGTFSDGGSYSLPPDQNYVSDASELSHILLVADFAGDGLLGIGGGSVLLLNDGHGRFGIRASPNMNLAYNNASTALTEIQNNIIGAGDFNSDGAFDLVQNSPSGITVGSTTLTAPDGQPFRYPVVVGSIDGNTLPDIIAADGYNLVTYQNVSPPAQSAQISAKVDSLGLKVGAIPGDRGRLRVTLTNDSSVIADGRIAVAVFATAVNRSGGPIQIQTPKLDSIRVHLKPNQSTSVTSAFVVPSVATDIYEFNAQVSSLSGFSLVAGASNAPVQDQIIEQFGNVGGLGNIAVRHNLSLTVTAPDGGIVTFRLQGPGNGNLDDGLNHITLTGATAATRVTITQRGGSPLEIGALVSNRSLGLLDIQRGMPFQTTVNGNVGKLMVGVIPAKALPVPPSPGFQQFGSLAVTGEVGLVSGNVVGGIMSFGGSTPMNVRIGTPAFAANENQFTLRLATTAPINELSVKSADDTASFNAPSIRMLRSDGNFSASLTLQGPPVKGDVLGDVKIGGSAIYSATTDGFNAWITDGNIGSITIGKGVSQMRILAGLILGPNDTPSTNSIPATIGRLRIGGAVSSTVIIAGMKENVPGYSPDNGVFPGGAVGPITIGGALSPGSKITADVLPPIVSINGKKSATAGDQRFMLNFSA